jgi:hypothetical protein
MQLSSSVFVVLWWWQCNPAGAWCCSKAWWEGMMFEALWMKILLHLRPEPVMVILAGVVPLLGGISEKC